MVFPLFATASLSGHYAARIEDMEGISQLFEHGQE
jgi:hypothetical protein